MFFDNELTYKVLLEQFDYLIDHYDGHMSTDCPTCLRWLGIELILTEPWNGREPPWAVRRRLMKTIVSRTVQKG